MSYESGEIEGSTRIFVMEVASTRLRNQTTSITLGVAGLTANDKPRWAQFANGLFVCNLDLRYPFYSDETDFTPLRNLEYRTNWIKAEDARNMAKFFDRLEQRRNLWRSKHKYVKSFEDEVTLLAGLLGITELWFPVMNLAHKNLEHYDYRKVNLKTEGADFFAAMKVAGAATYESDGEFLLELNRLLTK